MDAKYVGKRAGFTGTQKGMTHAQKVALKALLNELSPTEFHHGDCVGADDEAAKIAADLFADEYSHDCVIVRHPPLNQAKRAFNDLHDEDRPAKDYHARNRDIVNETDILIGASDESHRKPYGGTWYTIGYAESKDKPRFVIWPDGTAATPEDDIS